MSTRCAHGSAGWLALVRTQSARVRATQLHASAVCGTLWGLQVCGAPAVRACVEADAVGRRRAPHCTPAAQGLAMDFACSRGLRLCDDSLYPQGHCPAEQSSQGGHELPAKSRILAWYSATSIHLTQGGPCERQSSCVVQPS